MRISDWSSGVCSSDLHKLILKSLDDDKAEDIVSIDLTGKSSVADYLVIASGRSSRQVGAMAEHLVERVSATVCRKLKAERAEVRRVAEELVRTCRSRWARCH